MLVERHPRTKIYLTVIRRRLPNAGTESTQFWRIFVIHFRLRGAPVNSRRGKFAGFVGRAVSRTTEDAGSQSFLGNIVHYPDTFHVENTDSRGDDVNNSAVFHIGKHVLQRGKETHDCGNVHTAAFKSVRKLVNRLIPRENCNIYK